ncbi:MAG TPA: sigma-70 family RNA polymerase sigma factor [Blastocatellia bacterium]|nr:sigma-70 family RNA polymerase sigma factor [Blastocatellia bacterium]
MAEKSPITEAEQRFNRIIEEHGALLRSQIARLCPKDLGLQFGDIEQEARLRLWRAIEGEREIRDAASYIYRIAVTSVIDAVRRVKARREDQLRLAEEDDDREAGQIHLASSAGMSPDRLAERRQIIDRVQQIISRFADDRRRAVGLHLQGMTTYEIAEVLGWSEPKARNLVYRALRELREQLRAEGIEYETE